jgi:hypothetical protein
MILNPSRTRSKTHAIPTEEIFAPVEREARDVGHVECRTQRLDLRRSLLMHLPNAVCVMSARSTFWPPSSLPVADALTQRRQRK